MRWVVLTLLLAGCASPLDEKAVPDSVAVLGDSISRGTNALDGEFGEWPIHSWATGNDANDSVTSHFERLRALHEEGADVVAFNDARSGARMADMAEQAALAVRQRAGYVVVLLGANDVCARTDVETFRAQLAQGASTLAALDAPVLVASVPDVTQLRDLFEDDVTARTVWAAYDVCPAVLGPGADVEDARVRTRAFNDALRDEARARGWRWDDGAVTATTYDVGDVSTADYFHPSLAGQAKLAEATWRVGPFAEAMGAQ